MIKLCKKCGIEKSVKEFAKDSKRKDSLYYCCRECDSKRKKESRLKKQQVQKEQNEYYPKVFRFGIDMEAWGYDFERLGYTKEMLEELKSRLLSDIRISPENPILRGRFDNVKDAIKNGFYVKPKRKKKAKNNVTGFGGGFKGFPNGM